MKKIFKSLIVLLLIIAGALALLMIEPINLGVAVSFLCATTASLVLALE
jgi:hypothetical protein